jgi:hypothetical protein
VSEAEWWVGVTARLAPDPKSALALVAGGGLERVIGGRGLHARLPALTRKLQGVVQGVLLEAHLR